MAVACAAGFVWPDWSRAYKESVLVDVSIVLVMFWVAIPASVVERPGVIASLKRSASLTKGHRWRIFGIYFVILITMMVASGMAQTPLAVSTATSGIATEMSAIFIATNILALLVNAFFVALGAVASAVAYHDLRAVKEGFDIDQYASVFD